MSQQTITLPKLGQYIPEQGGIFAGLLLGEDGNTYGLIVARKDDYTPIKGEYGSYGTTIEGAANDSDGLANTRAMAAAGSIIAKQVAELRIGDFDDWHIPARNQARMAHTNAPAQFPGAWTWTSTQGDAHGAWFQYSNGYQYWSIKGSEGLVVPVRRFLVI